MSIYGDNEQWMVMAKKDGSQRECRIMGMHFGVASSKDELLSRVRHALMANPEFRRKWWGWRFVAVRVDDAIVVGVNDVVHVYRNDSQLIRVSA